MKRYLILFASLLMASSALARQAMTPAPINVRSADGTVSNYPYQLKFPNGDLTDNADGTMTVADSTAALSASAIIRTSTLQSGATFYVSSGTAVNFNSSTATISTLLTIPNGVNATDAAAFGQVAYFQAPVSSNTTTTTSTSGNTYVSTALGATITPQTATTRIKITVTGGIQVGATIGAEGVITVFAGAARDLDPTGNGCARLRNEAALILRSPAMCQFIDNPLTAGATTYTVKIKNSDNSTAVNFPSGSTEQSWMILEGVK